MEVSLKRVDNDFNFEAQGESKVIVKIDGAESIGGHNNGARPMELLLMGLGSCSAIDIIQILKKQKQKIREFDITIEAERYKDRTPSLFKSIHVIYKLKGDINKSKLERAVELSTKKYCSVSQILSKTVSIKYSFVLN